MVPATGAIAVFITCKHCNPIRSIASGLVLIVSLLAAGPGASARDREQGMHPGHSGDGGGGGGSATGVAIGIGTTLMERALTAPQTPARSDAEPSTRSRKHKNAADAGRGSRNRGRASADQRYIPDEILTEFSPSPSPQLVERIARRYRLTQIASENFSLLDSTVYRWRIEDGRSAAQVLRSLERERAVASVQPNYIFVMQDEKPASGIAGVQYVLDKLHVKEAHQLAKGDDVIVAVLDTKTDAASPELAGAILNSFDALGGGDKPHKHATAIAGAIASHGKLTGIAPDARLLAVRAFDDGPSVAKGNSFAVYRGLQWASDNGARIVNMSFAGPADPIMHRMLAAIYKKGLVLIAAAGNSGPDADPLYPGADANVIAVTATDGDDNLYKMANRGSYVTVAAPGVDILAAAPGGTYQLVTGTSIATAHVSGVVALLLQRKPTLNMPELRALLAQTSQKLDFDSKRGRYDVGLVNAYLAVLAADGKTVVNDAGKGLEKQ